MREGVARGELLERPPIDVGDQVAEVILLDDASVERVALDGRARQIEQHGIVDRPAERVEVDAAQQPGGGRREAIAAFERAADRRPEVAALGQLDDAPGRRVLEDGGEQPVVGRDEAIVPRLGRDAAARRADAGIDDGDEHGAGGEISEAGGELERPAEHVVRGDVVGDVDEREIGADAQRGCLHRSDVVVAQAEVGQQREDGT